MNTRREVKTAAALVIGNELLSGKIADANTVVLARTLRRCGTRLERVVMVLDEVPAIVKELKALSEAHDVVFTSGGVGPTHDDLTIDAVAQAFDVDVVISAQIEELLREYYQERFTDGHQRMARIPEGARLVVTEHMPWPTIVMRNVWVLPGVPEIFAMKMPVVMNELSGTPVISVAVYTTLDEGRLKPHLDAIVAEHADIEVGSYPKFRHPQYRTKVTFDGPDEVAVIAARDAFVVSLPEDAIVPNVVD
jgi:molybdenum cofactor synthesis domain-containing protein